MIDQTLTGVAADLAVLYELSLAVGQSLDLRTNCDSFLSRLMARKDLALASVWLRGALVGEPSGGGALSLAYANPQYQVRETAVPADHPMLRLLGEHEWASVASGDARFGAVVTERDVTRGAYALFSLRGLGVLKLYAMGRDEPFSSAELARLAPVVRNFAVSVEGCLAHAAAVREVAERQRAEQAQRESERRLSTLLQNLPGMAYRCANDRDWTMEFVSEGVRALTGYEAAALCGNRDLAYNDVIHPDDRAAVWNDVQAGLARDGAYRVSYRLVTAGGETRSVIEHGRGVFAPDGALLALEGLVMDITDRVRAEAESREQEYWLRTLINAMPDVVCFKDGAGRWLVANDYDLELFELRGVDYRGRKDSELAQHTPFYRDALIACEDSDELAWKAGRLVQVEETVPRPDGTTRVYELIKLPLFEYDGRRKGLVVVGRDVTDARRAEAERRKLEVQVQHAQKLESLGVMAGGIAHDFNNLLTGILGNASLALMGLDEAAAARHNVEQIEVAALRAAELTNQLLAYSGKGKFVGGPLNLSDLVVEMAHLLETAISKKALLHFELDDATPLVQGDAAQVRQVVMNLITNASDAIGERSGTITIRTGTMFADREFLATTYTRADASAGPYAYVEVADTGVGMDAATQARIFDPFFTTKFTGRGLGLAAVLGIVRGHEGALRVDSVPGRGTTFRVLFPLAEETAGAAPRRADPTPMPWRGSGTVLVVDDDPTVLEVARLMIERLGFQVVTAIDGPRGLAAFRSEPRLDAVLLDLTMPGMSGDEVFREMRRMAPDVPVVLSSGYSEQDATSRFTGGGLAGFVQKPYEIADLAAKLREAVERGR